MADTDFKRCWDKWVESQPGDTYVINRLHAAFSYAWNAKPAIEYAPYESTIIAISTDAGYLALHERIQEGWEPLLCWSDDHGEHMAMRRLRI